MGYKKPFLPPKVTATCNILNHTLIYSTSHRASIIVYHQLCSQTMSTKESPPKTVIMAPLRGLFGLKNCRDDYSESPDNGTQPATCKHNRSGQHAIQYQPLHGSGYSPSQPPFPGSPQFYHHSPFNMKHNSSQPTTSVSQQYPRYAPLWQGFDLPQGGSGKSQMFPQQQFQGQEPLSPGAP